jgi:superoxide reductase
MRTKMMGNKMNRRGFIRLSALGAATGIIAPISVLASTDNMAGGVYYTKDAPGRWSKKVDEHLPNISIAKGKSGNTIEVVTSHGMTGYEHYIVKHTILNARFEFITENMFDPMKDKAPISQFDLGSYSGRIHVLSVCNKHDTWLNVADI